MGFCHPSTGDPGEGAKLLSSHGKGQGHKHLQNVLGKQQSVLSVRDSLSVSQVGSFVDFKCFKETLLLTNLLPFAKAESICMEKPGNLVKCFLFLHNCSPLCFHYFQGVDKFLGHT